MMNMAVTMQEFSPIPPLLSNKRRAVAFTTPLNYAGRLSHLLQLKGWSPLCCPTIVVEPSPQTKASIQFFLSTKAQSNDNKKTPLEDFSAIAFTSRAGILAFSETLMRNEETPLEPYGENFTVSALGKMLNFLTRISSPSSAKKPSESESQFPLWRRRRV
ncbi:hypothetical protein CK203_069464 [Vitis vinifera]|uniref:Uroporphyrinogen-III synthase n=1 Tax=Vitis vinifera TaxID=29760 RepID=A0A438BZW1_VITVI|nr:hypothetical protein CK203_069464 [Vitis vinifera]